MRMKATVEQTAPWARTHTLKHSLPAVTPRDALQDLTGNRDRGHRASPWRLPVRCVFANQGNQRGCAGLQAVKFNIAESEGVNAGPAPPFKKDLILATANWRDRLFAFMVRNATDVPMRYPFPSGRVVEPGFQARI